MVEFAQLRNQVGEEVDIAELDLARLREHFLQNLNNLVLTVNRPRQAARETYF